MFTRRVTKLSTSALCRHLWTHRTVSGSTLSACVSQGLTNLSTKPINVCVALVSRSFPSTDLASLNAEIAKHIQPHIFLGAVVDRVPCQASGGHGLSILIGQDEDVTAFALEDSVDRKKIKSVSVGRWGRVQDFNRFNFEENDLDKFGWESFKSVSTNAQAHQQLPELQNLKNSPKFAWIISDHEPYQVIESLDHQFPHAIKAGLIGTSTPFTTGTPYTMFYNGKHMAGGSIGFVSSSVPEMKTKVEFQALEKLGNPMTITRCRGNIILDLDESSATGLLLDLLNKGHNAKISKEKEFYLGTCADHGEDNASLVSVHKVTSGDPSKGNMSIDTTADFKVGQRVQFLHRMDVDESAVIPSAGSPDQKQIICSVTDKDGTIEFSKSLKQDIESMIPAVFGGSSENGALVGLPNQPTYVFDAPYSHYVISTK
ncbi:hypothetical protein INT43_003352 [Umbelopsis isabellina]|uniref:FIST domain-containing protein n=1 Tax=Mortierella isabellina TaxID=91625 RepID=A0A8H7PRC7_MORIS|nr:hypothetical protein INT43_003352 [Umbelopsis isabellina]